MLESMFKVLLKIIKNKKFTKFSAVVALMIMSFMVCSSNTSLVQTIVYIINLNFVKLLSVFLATFLLSVNIQLGLLFVMFVVVVMNIPLVKTEHFSGIPNMVDKGAIIKYNKNFKEPKKIKNELDKKKLEKTIEEQKSDELVDKKENEKKNKKKKYVISEDYYHEKRGVNKDDKEKNNVEEVNLDDEEDTIERELKKKFTNDLKKMEEFDSSSSDSSNSESSDSSTDSSDSEKEVEEVSMDKAREHMLKKLRNGLKKRYIHD
jgi:hypothetical protein